MQREDNVRHAGKMSGDDETETQISGLLATNEAKRMEEIAS